MGPLTALTALAYYLTGAVLGVVALLAAAARGESLSGRAGITWAAFCLFWPALAPVHAIGHVAWLLTGGGSK